MERKITNVVNQQIRSSDEELIMGVERARAKLLSRSSPVGSDKDLNTKIADILLLGFKTRGELNDSQRSLAKQVIDFANKKVRI